MKRIRIEETYHCSTEQYWDMLTNHELRAEREVKGCGALSFEILADRWDDDTYHQTAEIVEAVDAPMPVRKIFGETTRIKETSIWKRGSDTVQISYNPDTMGDRVSMKGILTCTPKGDGQCLVVLELEITAKIFVVGGIVESLVAKALPRRQAKDSDYFNAHQAPK